MKFRSTTGEDVYLALTNGHTAIVPPGGCELDPKFHREAIANGCLPDGVQAPQEDNAPQVDRKSLITDAINAMLAGSDPEDFTSQGKPSMNKLVARVGFNASRSEVDAVWDGMQKSV